MEFPTARLLTPLLRTRLGIGGTEDILLLRLEITGAAEEDIIALEQHARARLPITVTLEPPAPHVQSLTLRRAPQPGDAAWNPPEDSRWVVAWPPRDPPVPQETPLQATSVPYATPPPANATAGTLGAATAATATVCECQKPGTQYKGVMRVEEETHGKRYHLECVVCGRELQPSWFVPKDTLRVGDTRVTEGLRETLVYKARKRKAIPPDNG